MKPLLLSLPIFFISITGTVAQTFSLTELFKFRTLTYPEFETAVTRKGYQYIETENDDFLTSYSFAYNDYQGKAGRFVSYTVHNKDNSIHVAHQTSFLSDYTRLKKSALEAGFRYYETGQTPNKKGVYLAYKKGGREVWFISSRGENDYGQIINYYEISVD